MVDFSVIARFFDELEKIPGKIDLAEKFKEFDSKLDAEDSKTITYLLQGILGPAFKTKELGVAEKLCLKALEKSSGIEEAVLEKELKKLGDLGLLTQKIMEKRKQTTLSFNSFTLEEVYDKLIKITELEGEGSQNSRISLLCELLSNSSPVEGKHLMRFVSGIKRLGVGDGILVDGLRREYEVDKKLVEKAYYLTSDLGRIALLLKQKKDLTKIKIEYFNPIMPALAERADDAKDIYNRMKECYGETKYDGMRIQVHKKGNKVKLFSRRLEEVTNMFPEITEKALKIKHDFIVEGETIGIDAETKQILPFQELMTRKRKHDIKEKTSELPIKFLAFDFLKLDDEDLIDKPFEERRSQLIKIGFEVTQGRMLKSLKEIQAFFEQSIANNNEGIICKNLTSPYSPGSRGFHWIKLKQSYSEFSDTLDVIVMGYFLGKGKRTEFEFGGMLAGVKDDQGNINSIAKVGSGFSEGEMEDLKAALEELQTEVKPANYNTSLKPDYWVKPKLVIEVKADEMTYSKTHKACYNSETKTGIALRFPRMIAIRTDKTVNDATTEEEVKKIIKDKENVY